MWSRCKQRYRRYRARTDLCKRAKSPDFRVDPAFFPEDEFPIFCLKCKYELRGLPDGRCPECGEPLDRSRQLVECCVLRYGHGFGRRRGLIIWGLVVIGLQLLNVALMALHSWKNSGAKYSTNPQVWKQALDTTVFFSNLGLMVLVLVLPSTVVYFVVARQYLVRGVRMADAFLKAMEGMQAKIEREKSES